MKKNGKQYEKQENNMNNTDEIFAKSIIDTIPEKLKLNDLIPCRRCGICCKESNASFLSEELDFICKNLNIDPNEFREKYAISETKDNIHGIRINKPCPFFENSENKCKIYPIRPMSCRLYPFASLTITIKPCKKGLDIYNAIENWYKHKNEKIDKEQFDNTVKLINDFYSRIPYKIQCENKVLTDNEIDEILKNDEVKYHGITILPEKTELKKLIKYLKKKEKSVKVV